MYRKIRLTATRLEVLGASWKQAQRQTLNMISGLLAVRESGRVPNLSVAAVRQKRRQQAQQTLQAMTLKVACSSLQWCDEDLSKSSKDPWCDMARLYVMITAEVIEGTDEVYESTAGANLSTEPLMKVLEDEAGPSTFQDESDEFIQDDTLIADILVNILRPRRGAGITITGNIPEQQRPKSPTLILDPKDKGKGIMKEEPKRKKLTLQQLRADKTANDKEVARKVAAE
ncbi:hypothetical protein Tco_0867241 [Tanacetum coccineum]